MTRAKYLTVSLALAVLLLAGIGMTVAYGQMGSMMGDQGASGGRMDGGMMGGQDGRGMGSMSNGEGMSGCQTMGSFDEKQPFDLQFIDQMTAHHEGAIMSSRMMISDSERPELRQLAQDIQKSQSEQIDQMQAFRDEWHPDAGQTSGMPAGTMGDGMTGDGMMGGSMQEMMGGDATNEMFLRMMIPHHQMAVDMSEMALDEAEHPELKNLARKIIEEQTAEIELMEGYLEEILAAEKG